MSDAQCKINELKKAFVSDCENIQSVAELKQIESKYLKTSLKELFSYLKSESDANIKKQIGTYIHEFKCYIEKELSTAKESAAVAKFNSKNVEKKYDVSVIKQSIVRGQIHPLTRLYKEIERVLVSLGFSVVQGPEIELDKNNFEKLNMPYHHPARDMQDTFYIENYPNILLRSHTSSVQIRIMEKTNPPIKIISPGTVYRVDDIGPQHTPIFYQVEGLVVDKNISFSDLKGVLIVLIQSVFGSSVKLRFRPSYYPYTEPSAAIDMSCMICNQKGCRTCSQSGWITILGAGMVHPNVFNAVGYDSDSCTGFAFGLGLNRLALIYYGLPEIRMLYENDILLYKQL